MKRNIIDAINDAIKALSAADKALDKIAEYRQIKDAKGRIDAVVADLADFASNAGTDARKPHRHHPVAG